MPEIIQASNEAPGLVTYTSLRLPVAAYNLVYYDDLDLTPMVRSRYVGYQIAQNIIAGGSLQIIAGLAGWHFIINGLYLRCVDAVEGQIVIGVTVAFDIELAANTPVFVDFAPNGLHVGNLGGAVYVKNPTAGAHVYSAGVWGNRVKQ